MKKIFTLAAAALMAVMTTTNVQAQVTVDGQIQSAEIAGGGYQLLGSYTGDSGFGDWRMDRLYAGVMGRKLHIATVGALEGNGNAWTYFLNLPGGERGGVAAGQMLPRVENTPLSSPYIILPMRTTHAIIFQATTPMRATLIDYTTATPTMHALGEFAAGTVHTVPAGNPLSGARIVYGGTTNWLTHNGTAGLEMELDMDALNIPAGSRIEMFGAMTGNTGFLSRNTIPAFQSEGNFGNGTEAAPVNFSTLPLAPGNTMRFVSYAAFPTSTRLAERIEGTSVYPNPINTSARISYTLTKSENVSVKVYDLLGREVAVLANGVQQAGTNNVDFSVNDVQRGGYYLVRVQAGDSAKTHKVSVIK